MMRFCADCCKESTETAWSDLFRARLCMDCYDLRCEVVDHGVIVPQPDEAHPHS